MIIGMFSFEIRHPTRRSSHPFQSEMCEEPYCTEVRFRTFKGHVKAFLPFGIRLLPRSFVIKKLVVCLVVHDKCRMYTNSQSARAISLVKHLKYKQEVLFNTYHLSNFHWHQCSSISWSSFLHQQYCSYSGVYCCYRMTHLLSCCLYNHIRKLHYLSNKYLPYTPMDRYFRSSHRIYHLHSLDTWFQRRYQGRNQTHMSHFA